MPAAAGLGRLPYAEALGLLHHLLAVVLGGAATGAMRAGTADVDAASTTVTSATTRGATDDA